MTGTDEFEIVARGHRLHAQRWGSPSAPLILALPGLTGNVKNFAFIGERVGGDRVQFVALDLRGRGASEATPSGTYGWEHHALDVFAVADALGFERFAVIGQSMGGSVAMKTAALDGRRLRAVVLIDVAGRVDHGVGEVIAASTRRVGRLYDSVEQYIDAVKAQGLVEPWTDYWDRAYRYDVCDVDGGIVLRTSAVAVAEDRAYTAKQDPYDRWRHLTMPTLLVRATQELARGAGHVVPADDSVRFAREVPQATVVEVDANHLTVNTHPSTASAVRAFLTSMPTMQSDTARVRSAQYPRR